MRNRVVPQPGMNFEYLMWLFTRLSGLGLILMALIGIAGAFMMSARLHMDIGTVFRWVFFPNYWHIASSELPSTDAWVTPWWGTIQTIMVGLGITHGINGLRMITEDYVGRTLAKPLIRGLLFLIWLFLIIVAFNLIWTDSSIAP